MLVVIDRRWRAEDGVEQLLCGAVVGRLQFTEVEWKRARQRAVETRLNKRCPVVLQDHVTTHVILASSTQQRATNISNVGITYSRQTCDSGRVFSADRDPSEKFRHFPFLDVSPRYPLWLLLHKH